MGVKFEKSFVLYANENYYNIVKTCVKSIREFSDLPVIVYFLNCDLKLDIENVITINWSCDLGDDKGNMYHDSDANFYINRSNEKIFKLLIQRPNITKHALLNYSETIAYIDSDVIVTPYIDRVFDLYDTNKSYPYATEGVYDYLFVGSRGGANSRDDLSTTLEHPVCELFGINQYVRQRYRTTNIFVAGQNTIEFLEEWYWMCNHPKVLKNFEWYAPFHEETILNVLLWKYNFLEGLPYVYVNGGSDEIDEIYGNSIFTGTEEHIRPWIRIPSHEENLLVFHGEKRIDKMEEMIKKLKEYVKEPKKNIVKSGLYYKGKKIADKGFILNLPERKDRLEQCTSLLSELGFSGYEVFPGTIMKKTDFKKLGCTASYLKMFENVLDSDIQDIVVFEDDIKLINSTSLGQVDKIFDNWKTIKDRYDIVALGTKLLPRTKIEIKSETDGYFEEMLCTQSFYYKRKIISHIHNELKNFLNPNHPLYKCTIDMFLNDCSSEKYKFVHYENHKKFDFGVTIPMIFSQSESFSDNELTSQNYDEVIEQSFYKSLKQEKSYVLYSTENYLDIVTECAKSIREFSQTPIIIYLLNSNKKINVPNTMTINWECDILDVSNEMFTYDNDNFYIDRRNSNIYKILIQRPLIVKDALEKYANTICYVDSDSVATPFVDNIFSLFDNNSSVPYFVEGIYEFMSLYGKGGGGGYGGGLSSTLEHNACVLFGVDQSNRRVYRQSGYFVAGQQNYDFINEWYEMCNHPTIWEDINYYAPFNEETIANVLLWKKNIHVGLPYIYVNGTVDTVKKMYKEVRYKGPGVINHIGDWLRAPQDKEHLLFFHGEKNPKKMKEMVEEIKNYNKKSYQIKNNKNTKILFVAPHLSTGGMPGFLLKKIELLKKYCPEFEIYVVEYQSYGEAYVVQRNKIIEIIDKDKFWTLGSDKFELMRIIKSNNIDIVHVQEMIEGFDSFNQMPPDLMRELYSNDRTWKMVETCHNVWFNPEEHKIFYPEAFAFCTPYHRDVTFKNTPSYGENIEFPIEKKIFTQEERNSARKELGFGKDKIHVINVGLWTKGKNQGEGVEIAKLLKKDHPEIIFHFIGNQAPNFKDYWGPIMKNLPMNIKVWGERSDIDTFMKAADVFMFNSTWECNPLVLREAISYGLKVLCRNLPQYLDMFTEYIEPIDDNIENTKEKLLSLISKDIKYKIPEGQEKDFAFKYSEFYKKTLDIPIREQYFKSKLSVTQYFIEQPFIELQGRSDNKFKVQFFDEKGFLHYENILPINTWVKLNRRYFTRWHTKVWENDSLVYENILNFENKRVYIAFDSKSLGDTISWIPYAEEFRNTHKCKVVVSTFWNHLFEKVYPELEFVKPGNVVNNIHGMYKLGWFYNTDMQPTSPNLIPLQKTATDILGLDFKEIRPKIHFEIKERPYNEKYITIATNSTAGCKFWTREGWQELINYLVSQGYKVVNVSKEDNPFENQTKISDTSIENTINVIHHSEFFIGLSSGLSWLAWGLNKHVVMISNFTTPDHEFQSNCTRIINLSVCNGCWNKKEFSFDKGDWDWCPVHKGTERQFECHKSITSQMLISKIKHLI
jgi:autotransporter strand-loop-strand O-heptosyltransferase